MSHPIMHPDSVRPGYNPSLRTSLVTVVTGHTGYYTLEEEVEWKLICLYLYVLYNKHFQKTLTLRHGKEYVGYAWCPKAVGSIYNCSVVGCYFSIWPTGICIVSIDRQTLNDSSAFLSLCLSVSLFLSMTLLRIFISPSLSLSVFQGLIMKFITVTDRRVTPV